MLLQLELGSTATPYEPYKESIGYISAKDENGDVIELRRLPNGVCDEIDVTAGKVNIKNENYVLHESDIIEHDYQGEGNYRVELAMPSDIKTASSNDWDWVYVSGWSRDLYDNRKTTIGTYYTITQSGQMKIIFCLPYGTTLEQAREQLAGTTLIYQLATEKVIDIQPQTLTAYPKGTIVIESCYNQAFVYNSSDGGLKFDYAISNIEKIRKNGVDIDFTANIAPDGKSATVAELSDGDVVHVIAPIRPEESAVPEVIHSVPVNQAGVIANNTAAISAHNKAIQLINEDLAILIVLNT